MGANVYVQGVYASVRNRVVYYILRELTQSKSATQNKNIITILCPQKLSKNYPQKYTSQNKKKYNNPLANKNILKIKTHFKDIKVTSQNTKYFTSMYLNWIQIIHNLKICE